MIGGGKKGVVLLEWILSLSSKQVNREAPKTQSIMISGNNVGEDKGTSGFPPTDKIILLKNTSMLLWIYFTEDKKNKLLSYEIHHE